SDPLLTGPDLQQARGWYRKGTILVLEGRLSAALEAFHEAVACGRRAGHEAGIVPALSEWYALARVLGLKAETETVLKEAVSFYGRFYHQPALLSEAEFRSELLRGHCPDPTPHFVAPQASEARRRLELRKRRRAAAMT